MKSGKESCQWLLAPSKDFRKMKVGETCMCNGLRAYISHIGLTAEGNKSIVVGIDRRLLGGLIDDI